MATQILRDATVWLHDCAVHEIGDSLDLQLGMESQDCTVWGSQARKYAGGLFTAELSAEGYADMTGYDSSLWTTFRARTDAVVSASADSTDFSVGYFFEASNHELTPLSGSVGDMAAVSVSATTRNPYGAIRGNILLPSASRNTNGSGTARQLGAVSATQRVFSAVHVTSIVSGTPSLTVRIQSDDNGGMSSPTTRTTHTAMTTTTAEFKSTTGAFTDDWWRVDYSIASGSLIFVVFVGIA